MNNYLISSDVSPSLRSAYINSMSLVSRSAIRTVVAWRSQEPEIDATKAIKATKDINDRFTDIISQVVEVRLLIQNHTSIIKKGADNRRVRFTIHKLPSRRQVGKIAGEINDLGKEMAQLNVNSAYLIADALEKIKEANQLIFEMEQMELDKRDFLDLEIPGDKRRFHNIVELFKDHHEASIIFLNDVVRWLKVSEQMWNRVGAIDKWKVQLRDLQRKLLEYEKIWDDKHTRLNRVPTFEEYAGERGGGGIRKELTNMWLHAVDLMPEDMIDDNKDFEVIDGWLLNFTGDGNRRPHNPLLMIKEVKKAINKLLALSASKTYKAWLTSIRSLYMVA